MAEYIDREAVKRALADSDVVPKYKADNRPVTDKIIDDIPAADVAPVVHGRWVNFYGDFSVAECSECESQFEVTFDDESNGALWDGFRQFYNYCPACRAKMDGKGEEA